MSKYSQRFKTVEQRFWEKVDRTNGETECWVWKAGLGSDGYGAFGFRGRSRPAHRVVWTITNGEIPPGMQICHHCDNPPCVNPSHLFLGTNADNMADKTLKKRNNPPRGERAGMVKLTTEQVLTIRELYQEGARQRHIAPFFGVGYKAIHKIVHGQRWKHV